MHLFRLFERQIKALMVLGYLGMATGLGWTVTHPPSTPVTLPDAPPSLLDDATVAGQARPALRPAKPVKPPLPHTRNQSRADKLSARQV